MDGESKGGPPAWICRGGGFRFRRDPTGRGGGWGRGPRVSLRFTLGYSRVLPDGRRVPGVGGWVVCVPTLAPKCAVRMEHVLGGELATKLVERVAALGQTSMAMTDYGEARSRK